MIRIDIDSQPDACISGCDDGVCIDVAFEEVSLQIPLADIKFDEDIFFFNRAGMFLSPPGGEETVENEHLRAAIALLKQWIKTLERRLEDGPP